MPRLRQHDVTIEKVAELLADAAPKGLLIVRDELLGWIQGMSAYHAGGRSFWIEAYGGRPYRVERKSELHPISIARLAVAVYGGTQPEKLARLLQDGDDGLLGRMLWVWPEPIPFRLGQRTPRADWAIRALDRLRELDLHAGPPPEPIRVSLSEEARRILEHFGRDMQEQQASAGRFSRAALGKARGQALRLSLVIEMLWWCGQDGSSPPPTRICSRGLATATELIGNYFLQMAERVYADTPNSTCHRSAATLARWILETGATDVHIRHLQRAVRLPGLRTAAQIREAAVALIVAGWLRPPAPTARFGPRKRVCLLVNPAIHHGRHGRFGAISRSVHNVAT
jgi:Protein of unknown function (DUF3987)